MLSTEYNALITQVSPGTPMGTLMREYWIPAMLSVELPHPDSDPVRVLLLGEQLIGFRNTEGRVGLIQNLCPHRGASLFYGRNEDNAIRCVYHGWQFDISGACIDMPNEPVESTFKNRVKACAYPCVEKNGIIWTYMGPRQDPPPLPHIPGNSLPEGEYTVSAFMRDCNWLQGMEGDLDTSHTNFLHSGASRAEDYPEGSMMHFALRNRAPKFTTLDTDYGCLYGAYRPAGPGEMYWRLSQFLFPFHTNTGGLQNKSWVPMDDHHTMVIRTNRNDQAHGRAPVHPNSTDWLGRFRPVTSGSNDYMIDRELQRNGNSYTGIAGDVPVSHQAPVQDQAVTESMGPVLDRTVEHLGTADAMLIRVRERLIEAARALAEGKEAAPAVDDPEAYFETPAGRVIMPESASLSDAANELRRKPQRRSDISVPWSEVRR